MRPLDIANFAELGNHLEALRLVRRNPVRRLAPVDDQRR